MSEENVETVRAINDAYNRGDFDAVREKAEPEFGSFRPGLSRPLRAQTKFASRMEPDAFESQVIELLELREAGNKVLARARSKIRGAGSGIEIEVLASVVWTFNEAGRTIKLEIYLDHEKADAFKAAGLSE